MRGAKGFDRRRVRILIDAHTKGGAKFRAGEVGSFFKRGVVRCIFETDDGRAISVGNWSAASFELVLEDTFRECDGCRVKPGTPELCADCLERRTEHTKTGRCLAPRVCSDEEQEAARELDARMQRAQLGDAP